VTANASKTGRLTSWLKGVWNAPVLRADTKATFKPIELEHHSGLWRSGDEIVYQLPRQMVRRTFILRQVLLSSVGLAFIALDDLVLEPYDIETKSVAILGFFGYMGYELIKGKIFNDHPVRAWLHRKQSHSDLSRVRFHPDAITFTVGDLSTFVLRRGEGAKIRIHAVKRTVEGESRTLRLVEVVRDGKRSTVDVDDGILTHLIVAWDQGFDRLLEYSTAAVAVIDDGIRNSKLLERNPVENSRYINVALPYMLEPPSYAIEGDIDLSRYFGDPEDRECLHPEPETRPRLDMEFLKREKPEGRALRFFSDRRSWDVRPPKPAWHRVEVPYASNIGFLKGVVAACIGMGRSKEQKPPMSYAEIRGEDNLS
jgi:hypothetical protein